MYVINGKNNKNSRLIRTTKTSRMKNNLNWITIFPKKITTFGHKQAHSTERDVNSLHNYTLNYSSDFLPVLDL